MGHVSGTEGYAEEAAELLRRYESIAFVCAHRSILHLLPQAPSSVLDIGAGTGRDAAALAERGHRVLAVEPTAEMRGGAMGLHPTPSIEWIDDSLPHLPHVRERGEVFDFVMLSAVWMHLDQTQRRQGMPSVASLVRPGGLVAMSLRHGPVPPGRRMFEVPTLETVRLAAGEGLHLVLDLETPSSRQPGVSWTRLAFVREDR
ncbi:MAG: class I SAM-dependent methyltransferase [Alphaproteobacteria bacterium]|nr:class I SAM-dependent methyltransferase [Alphaproteobacteria bacterium]